MWRTFCRKKEIYITTGITFRSRVCWELDKYMILNAKAMPVVFEGNATNAGFLRRRGISFDQFDSDERRSF